MFVMFLSFLFLNGINSKTTKYKLLIPVISRLAYCRRVLNLPTSTEARNSHGRSPRISDLINVYKIRWDICQELLFLIQPSYLLKTGLPGTLSAKSNGNGKGSSNENGNGTPVDPASAACRSQC